MANMQRPVEPLVPDEPAIPLVLTDTIEERRARRMAALRKAAGMWADRNHIPADGMEYQRAMRAEWPWFYEPACY